jgi:hypothetical protein
LDEFYRVRGLIKSNIVILLGNGKKNLQTLVSNNIPNGDIPSREEKRVNFVLPTQE